MKLSDYLDFKYEKCPKALSKAECLVAGIPYPLQTGWILRFADLEIDPQAMSRAAIKSSDYAVIKERRRENKRKWRIDRLERLTKMSNL
jgi:hypothetical protein